MSLEEELAELSTVYHGQRETLQQLVTELDARTAHALQLEQKLFYANAEREPLRQLVRDFITFTDWLDDDNVSDLEDWLARAVELQQRAKELLGD